MPREGDVNEPDPQVVGAARRGDLDAFAQLVRLYQGDVWRLAFHLLRDRTLADDITQDAFIRAFRFLPRFRGDARFTTWLLAIARNCAIDELRRSARRSRVADQIAVVTTGTSPDRGVTVEVRDAVAKLPLDLREPVVLIDMFGLSYRDVSGLLRIPEGTVKSRVHRAREQLAAMLAPANEDADER
jgi:RNA polymerase sigma-70 factor, ECF subfamily